MQLLDSHRTTWHITFGTYGTRLHGGIAATVDKEHNQQGEPFLAPNVERERLATSMMKFPEKQLTSEQRRFTETILPEVCERGGWLYRIAAAQSDHVHVLCDVLRETHGEKVRRLIKRWLGQAFSKNWPLAPGARWWAVEGSNKAIHDEIYLNNAYQYIMRQRTTPQSQA